MRRALAAPMCLLGVACHKAAPLTTPDAGAKAAPDEAAASPSGDAEPERACHLATAARSSGLAPSEDLEFGEAVSVSTGAWVGLLRASGGSTLASVARVEDQAVATVVDLGVAAGDVPPPQPFLRGAEVFAAGYVRPAWTEAGAPFPPPPARPLTVFRVNVVAEPLVTLTQRSDESPSFDALAAPLGGPIGALVAWDEDAPGEFRGLIRVAALGPDLRAVVRTAVSSPETTDAERPALAPRATVGYWLAWIARKAEPPRDAGPELEGPGEDRVFRWVELVALDLDGKPAGPVRRLTSLTGHVSGFSMETHLSHLDLYAAEDDEPSDGAGGGIVHVAVEVDGPVRVAPIVSSGTARGITPAVVWRSIGQKTGETEGYLAYLDVADHARLVPLDREGAARSVATREPDLDDARLLATAKGGQILVALPRPDSGGGPFRWLSCVDVREDSMPAPFP